MPSSEDTRPMMPIDSLAVSDSYRAQLEQQAGSFWWLVVLMLSALALRLLVFVLGPAGDLSQAQRPESARYEQLAGNLMNHHAFALDPTDNQGPIAATNQLRADAGELETPLANGLQPELYLTPGYPAFLAAFQWMRLPGWMVLVGQCLLGALCVMLTYKLTFALLKSAGAGLLAAAVMAVHPGLVTVSNVMLPDVLWLTLMLAGLWLIVSSEQQPTASMAIGGLLLGVAVLVRPYALVLLVLLGLWAMLRQRKLAMVAAAVVMIVMACIPSGLWIARNYLIGAGPMLSTQPIIDGYYRTVADVRKLSPDESVDTLSSELRAARHENENVLSAMDRLTRQTVREHPQSYLATLKLNAAHLTTDHAMGWLYQQLGLTYQPPAVRHRILANGLTRNAVTDARDPVTAGLALSWIGFNVLLMLAGAVALPLLLWRGHWPAALLLMLLLGYALMCMHSNQYGQPQALALSLQATLAAGVVAPSLRQRKKTKVKSSREQRRIERERRRQRQCIGVEQPFNEQTSKRDPLLPGQGPQEGLRPI